MANKIEKLKANIKENYTVTDEAKLDKFIKDADSLAAVKRELTSLEKHEAIIEKNMVKSLKAFCKSINSTKSNYMRLYNNVQNAKEKIKAKIDKLAKKGKTNPVLEKDLKKIEESEAILGSIAQKRQAIYKLVNDVQYLDTYASKIKEAKKVLKQLNSQLKAKERFAKTPFVKAEEIEKLRKQRDGKGAQLQKLIEDRATCHSAIKTVLGGDIGQFQQAYLKQLAELEKNFTNVKGETKISAITSKNIQIETAALRFSAKRAFTNVIDSQQQYNLIVMNLGVDMKQAPVSTEPPKKVDPPRPDDDKDKDKGKGKDDDTKGKGDGKDKPGTKPVPPATASASGPKPLPSPWPDRPASNPTTPVDAEDVKVLSTRLKLSEELIKGMRENKSLDMFDYSVIADFINKNNCYGKEKEIISLYGLYRAGGITEDTLGDLLKTMTRPKLKVSKSIVDVPKTYKEFATEYGMSEDYAYEIYRVDKSDIAFVANKIISKNMTLDEAKEYIDNFKEISELKGKTAVAKKTTTKKTTKSSSKDKKTEPKTKKQSVEPIKAEEPIKVEEPVKTEPVIDNDVNVIGSPVLGEGVLAQALADAQEPQEIKTSVLGTDINETEPEKEEKTEEEVKSSEENIFAQTPIAQALEQQVVEPTPAVVQYDEEITAPTKATIVPPAAFNAPEQAASKTIEPETPVVEPTPDLEPVAEPVPVQAQEPTPAATEPEAPVIEPPVEPAKAEEPVVAPVSEPVAEPVPVQVQEPTPVQEPEIPVNEGNVRGIRKCVAVIKETYDKQTNKVKRFIVSKLIDDPANSVALQDGRNR